MVDVRRFEGGTDCPNLEVYGLNAGYYGRPVINDVSLVVENGSIVGLIGLNGSGKSTILLGIAGLTWSSANQIRIGGLDITEERAHSRAKKGIGILLQRHEVFPDLSIQRNLLLANVSEEGVLSPFIGSIIEPVIRSILQRGRILAGVLSGGERRLLGLAITIARHPRILLADEPTLGLAPDLESAVFSVLKANVGVCYESVLLVSHSLDGTERICEKVCLVAEGGIAKTWNGLDEGSLIDLMGF